MSASQGRRAAGDWPVLELPRHLRRGSQPSVESEQAKPFRRSSPRPQVVLSRAVHFCAEALRVRVHLPSLTGCLTRVERRSVGDGTGLVKHSR
jgi:hypothetical protein